MVEHLPGKHETLSSNTSIGKTNKQIQGVVVHIIISATQEADIGRIMVGGQLGQKVSKTPPLNQ
jgi:hypothetical protein